MEDKKYFVKVFRDNDFNLVIKQIEAIDDLEYFYNQIDCRCIDIQERKIGDEYFDFIIDDEYLLKEHQQIIPTLAETFEREYLFGTILITKSNDEGETIGLTKEQIEYVFDNLEQSDYYDF